jgi:hypothetical protein
MTEVEIFIPQLDNVGKLHSRAAVDSWHDKLNATFGGFSRIGSADGEWLDGVKVYRDTSLRYVVAVGGILRDSAKLESVIGFAKVAFDRRAIYVRYLGLSETL